MFGLSLGQSFADLRLRIRLIGIDIGSVGSSKTGECEYETCVRER